jgi:hypothetical protein
MNASARPRLARAVFTVFLILFGLSLIVSACVRETKLVARVGGSAPATAKAARRAGRSGRYGACALDGEEGSG